MLLELIKLTDWVFFEAFFLISLSCGLWSGKRRPSFIHRPTPTARHTNRGEAKPHINVLWDTDMVLPKEGAILLAVNTATVSYAHS